MSKINIIDREMTPEELTRMRTGFDKHTLEKGIALQNSERLGYVAMKGEIFIGCSSGLAYKNGTEYNGWFYLTDLFVERGYRLGGLGSMLLTALEEKIYAYGIKNIWTWTAGYEAPAFYIKQGYKIFAEFENWYSNGSSRLGLRKKLRNRHIFVKK
jgi:ribosomal protein S18 acetylase RimI-like enzyme